MSAAQLITPDVLVALGSPRNYAEKAADAFKAACLLHGFDSPELVACLLGQSAFESTRFTKTEEGLFYTTQAQLARTFKKIRVLPDAEQVKYLRNPKGLASFVYADMYGNGNVASGDGWKFRGQGYIQLTFHDNYALISKTVGRPYVEQPELLKEPSDAALSSVGFFIAHGITNIVSGPLTDVMLSAVTKKINPAMLEHATRVSLIKTALKLVTPQAH